MNKKRIERIATIAVAAFLVGYFCYQVAYGIETTLWPNGTRTFGDLPPGSTITNITGNAYNGSATIHVGPPPLDLTNTTWTIYNATSGSIGTITFKAYTVERGDEKGSLSTNPPPTYIRHLHGKTLEGSWSMGTAVGQVLELCSLHPHVSQSGCTDLTITTVSPNHIELQDSHGDTIRLVRNGMPQIAKAEMDCSRTDLTQDERYTCGYNHGYLDARTDWNLHRFPPQSGGDDSCPHATEHTPEYCNGYAKGYTYEWNTLYQGQQTPPTGPSLDTLYNKGLALIHLGNYTGAIEYFDRALAVDPNDKDALYYKGEALLALGNYTGAMLYYDRVLTIDPKDVAALDDKALSLEKLGNYTGAILYYDKALAIDPKHENALYNKGLILHTLGNDTGALTYLDKALAINPKDEDALYEKGVFLDKLGNHTGAIEYFDEALAVRPHDVDALNHKGVALNSLGNYTGAIEFYNKTLAIDPSNTFALTNKDVILHMLGNNTTPGNATNFPHYENSTYGIKMQYPSDWSVEGGSNPAIIASFYPQRNYTNYVMIQIENLSTRYTPDQYLNSLMLGDAADYKHFPDIRFMQNTTNNIVLAGHPGYLLNGTFRDPISDALQRFTNIGTVIGDKVYSIIYYSPAETYQVYNTIYLQMIKSFEIRPHLTSYQNTAYGIQIRYPSDWTIQESNASGRVINLATFISPIGPNSDPTAEIAIYMDTLHNSTTTLNNYAHFVAFTDYENRTSSFKLIELSTNSLILAGKPAYTLIGTYQDRSAGLQKLMEVGTIVGDKAYSVDYMADASRYNDYLPTVQKMIGSLQIKSQPGIAN